MIVVDVNLLLYAIDSGSPRHAAARTWWNAALSGDVPVGLPWVVVLAFLRLATNPRVFTRPLPLTEATALIDDWLAQPPARLLAPTERHWPILRDLLGRPGMGGGLSTDAHLAALAIEHGATLCSADADFARFSALRWTNPIA